MRYFLQQVILAAVALYITVHIFNGLRIDGIYSYAYSALLLVIGFAFIRPIINTLTLPIAALTFNMTAFLSTVIIVYLISLFNPFFTVSAFEFHGASIFGYTIPSFSANVLLSYIIISVTIHVTYRLLYYVFDL